MLGISGGSTDSNSNAGGGGNVNVSARRRSIARFSSIGIAIILGFNTSGLINSRARSAYAIDLLTREGAYALTIVRANESLREVAVLSRAEILGAINTAQGSSADTLEATVGRVSVRDTLGATRALLSV